MTTEEFMHFVEDQKRKRKRQTLTILAAVFGVVLLMLVVVVIAAETDSNDNSKNGGTEKKADSLAEADEFKNELLEQEIVKSKKVIDELKKKFYYTYDEFKKTGFYKHKNWPKNNWPTNTTITAGCNDSGYAWAQSNFHGNSWINHTYLTMIAGENNKAVSEVVGLFDSNNRREVADDATIYENITFSNSPQILFFVDAHSDKTIKVRLEGDQYRHDYTLTKNDKIALVETYQFANAIKILDESGIEYLE